MCMDITPHVTAVQEQLVGTAAIGGEELVAQIERLAPVLEPGIRLALLAALSGASAEITDQLSRAGIEALVEARLDGLDARFVVTPVEQEVPVAAPVAEEGDGVARVSLRLPAELKSRADAAAAAAQVSLNTWIVTAVRAHLDGARTTASSARRTARGNAHQGWN